MASKADGRATAENASAHPSSGGCCCYTLLSISGYRAHQPVSLILHCASDKWLIRQWRRTLWPHDDDPLAAVCAFSSFPFVTDVERAEERRRRVKELCCTAAGAVLSESVSLSLAGGVDMLDGSTL
jgi:hypothetical protein